MPSPEALSGDPLPPPEIHTKTSPEGDVATISSVTLDEAAILASVKDVKAGGLCCFVGTTRDTFKGQSLSLTDCSTIRHKITQSVMALCLTCRRSHSF